MTTLAPMRPENYAAFFEAAVALYAAENTAAGRWTTDEAEGLARAETERLLPQALATPDHHLHEILENGHGAQAVGYVWFMAMARGSGRIAFVVQVQVQPAFRRRGHARAALAAVEGLVAALGLPSIALNVFGHNTGAQALYRSLDYGVMSVVMQKNLAPGDTRPGG